MKLSTCTAAAVLLTTVAAAPASADIVKAPTGESGRLTLAPAVAKQLKKRHVRITRTGSTKTTKTGFALPYSLSRWDFAAHEGDVASFAKNTGIRFRGAHGRSIAMTHPRVVADGATAYITGLIANQRIKTFTLRIGQGKVSDTPTLQRISGLRLKLTKAAALLINKGLRAKVLRPYSSFAVLELRILKPAATTAPGAAPTTPAPATGAQAPGRHDNPGGTLSIAPGVVSRLLPGTGLGALAPGSTVDVNGDGQPDVGVVALPLKGSTFDVTSKTGTISLDGGLTLQANGQDAVVLSDPQVVLGTTPATSGLYATVNGVRLKVGDIDPSTVNASLANGTVTLSGLAVTATAPGATAVNALVGAGALLPGGSLATLDLSIPQS